MSSLQIWLWKSDNRRIRYKGIGNLNKVVVKNLEKKGYS